MESSVANGAEKKATRRMHDRRTCRQIYGVTTASSPLSRSITRAHAGHCSCCHPESCPSWRGSEGDGDDVGQRHVALTSERERETNEMGNGRGKGGPALLRHRAISSFFFTFSSSSSLPRTFSALLSSFNLPPSLRLPPEGGRTGSITVSVPLFVLVALPSPLAAPSLPHSLDDETAAAAADHYLALRRRRGQDESRRGSEWKVDGDGRRTDLCCYTFRHA